MLPAGQLAGGVRRKVHILQISEMHMALVLAAETSVSLGLVTKLLPRGSVATATCRASVLPAATLMVPCTA